MIEYVICLAMVFLALTAPIFDGKSTVDRLATAMKAEGKSYEYALHRPPLPHFRRSTQ